LRHDFLDEAVHFPDPGQMADQPVHVPVHRFVASGQIAHDGVGFPEGAADLEHRVSGFRAPLAHFFRCRPDFLGRGFRILQLGERLFKQAEGLAASCGKPFLQRAGTFRHGLQLPRAQIHFADGGLQTVGNHDGLADDAHPLVVLRRRLRRFRDGRRGRSVHRKPPEPWSFHFSLPSHVSSFITL